MATPTPVNYPSSPVVHIQTVCKGLVSGAGSNSRNTATVFNWYRVSTSLTVVKSQIDAAFQSSIVVPLGAALNARWLQSYNTIRYTNNWLDQALRFAHAVPGAISGDSMPTTASAYIELVSGLRYAFNRGSKKLFPLSESDTTIGTDDMLNAAAVVRFNTIAAAILAGFTDAGGNIWVPTILSTRYSVLSTLVTQIYAVPVTGAIVSNRVGSMRHRKVKSLLV